MPPKEQAQELVNELITIEAIRLRKLIDLAVDRIDQDPEDVTVDWQTGQILGALNDAARAARYAIAQRIIQRGGEDPGWGR